MIVFSPDLWYVEYNRVIVFMETGEFEAVENPISQMWELELKLKGMAYLIEQQGSDEAPPLPNEMETIHKGVGMILADLAGEIHGLRVSLEEENLKRVPAEQRRELANEN